MQLKGAPILGCYNCTLKAFMKDADIDDKAGSQLAADHAPGCRAIKIAAKELAGKMKSKREVWNFVAGEVRAYLPAYHQ